MKNIQCIFENRGSPNGFPDELWSGNIEGAMGELVTAKFLGVRWSPHVGQFKNYADVGTCTEVRTVTEKPGSIFRKKLIVRPLDDPSRKFWHIRGVCPNYEVVGWMFGHEAQQQKWLWAPIPKSGKPRPAAFFVPAKVLRKPEEHYGPI